MEEFHVLCFGYAREVCNSHDILISSSPTIVELCQELRLKYPRLGDVNFVVAVNHEYVDPNSKMVIQSSDEIALIPPISGG